MCAGVAQLVEQLICNQQVGGSSPSTSSIFLQSEYGSVPEWPKGADCKSVGTAFEGSNPSPSTRKKCFPIKVHIFQKYVYNKLDNIAGWSSLEARRAHNPKVVGSNPAPATKTL